MLNVDLNSDAWCDLVFEGRNQKYGAYYLRKTSAKRHLLALSVVMGGIIVILFFSKFIHFNINQIHQANEYELKPIELSNFIALEENPPDHPVKPEEKPLVKEIAKFTPPVIAEDESIEEVKEELRETNLAGDSTDLFSTLEEDTFPMHREIPKEEPDATLVENEKNKSAEFPDGQAALLRYIYQNIHYPPEALKQRIHGRVIYSFIINEDGSVSDITLVQGVYIFLDEEVLRVIRSMPLWKPAMKDGKAVKTKYVMPVVFRLN